MRQISLFVGWLLSLSCAGGCGSAIDFEASMVVSPDGAVTRKTRFIASSSKDELETRYALPPDGKWKIEKQTKVYGSPGAHWATPGTVGKTYEEILHVYEADEVYKPGSPIAPDYVRRAQFSRQASQNDPRLEVRNYVFLETFDYEERFRDIVNQQTFEKAVLRAYRDVVERTASYLAQERQDGLAAAQASEVIRTAFDPLLEKYLNAVRRLGVRRALQGSFNGSFKEADVFEPESVAGRLSAVMPPPAGQDVNSWRQAIVKAHNMAVSDVEKDSAFEEAFLGVYGFTLFASYDFNVALSLPGKLVESNATRQEQNRLVWSFRADDFVYEDYALRARSRLMYPARIGVAGTVFLAMVIGWLYKRRRR